MKITWIGQAGLVIKTNGKKILVDPYLSDSCEKLNPNNKRRIPVDISFITNDYDIVIFTHNHLDHTDPETYPDILKGANSLVLAPFTAWNEVRKLGGDCNYVMFNTGTVWTEGDLKFTAVKAEHSDREAIGVLIDNGIKRIYITGDTLYNFEVVESAPKEVDCIFLPVNGVGNNLNMTDAKIFCEEIGAKCAVPIHIGLFDSLTPDGFEFASKRVLEVYKEYDF